MALGPPSSSSASRRVEDATYAAAEAVLKKAVSEEP